MANCVADQYKLKDRTSKSHQILFQFLFNVNLTSYSGSHHVLPHRHSLLFPSARCTCNKCQGISIFKVSGSYFEIIEEIFYQIPPKKGHHQSSSKEEHNDSSSKEHDSSEEIIVPSTTTTTTTSPEPTTVEETTTTTPIPTTEKSLLSFCNSMVNGNYANPLDCHTFISCSNEITHVMV